MNLKFLISKAHSATAGWFTIKLAQIANFFFPNYKIISEDEDKVTRDEKEQKILDDDQLAHDNGGITVRLAVNMLNLADNIMQNLTKIKLPTFIGYDS